MRKNTSFRGSRGMRHVSLSPGSRGSTVSNTSAPQLVTLFFAQHKPRNEVAVRQRVMSGEEEGEEKEEVRLNRESS